jgi:hypothetical protein
MQLKRLFIVFYSFLFAAAAGDAAPRVIADGNPPLTSEMAAKSARFFEWLLDVRFTRNQQQEYEALLAREWSSEANRKSTLSLLQTVDRLDSVSEQKRREVRANLLESMLDNLRKTNDEDSRWLLAIYRSAHPEVSPAANFDARRLVGKWRDTKSAAVQYRSSTTGALAPTNGNSFFYQFFPDGTYEYNGLMQVSTYGCSTQLYANDSGKYHVEGNHLILEPSAGKTRTQQNCGSTGNTEKQANLARREYIARFETDSSGNVTLVTNGLTGGTRPDVFRSEK